MIPVEIQIAVIAMQIMLNLHVIVVIFLAINAMTLKNIKRLNTVHVAIVMKFI
jgi:hypothetical protein